MAHKCKDHTWTPPHTWEHMHLYVLQDIRDELKAMNATLSILKCPNFTAIPLKLERIARNTVKPKRRKK